MIYSWQDRKFITNKKRLKNIIGSQNRTNPKVKQKQVVNKSKQSKQNKEKANKSK